MCQRYSQKPSDEVTMGSQWPAFLIMCPTETSKSEKMSSQTSLSLEPCKFKMGAVYDVSKLKVIILGSGKKIIKIMIRMSYVIVNSCFENSSQ